MDYVRIFHDYKSKFQSDFNFLYVLSNCMMIYLYAGPSRFLYSGAEDISDIPCVGVCCFMHDSMSSSIPGLPLLDAWSTPALAVTTKNVSKCWGEGEGGRGKNQCSKVITDYFKM